MKLYDGQVGICYVCSKEEGDLTAKDPYLYHIICSNECKEKMKNET